MRNRNLLGILFFVGCIVAAIVFITWRARREEVRERSRWKDIRFRARVVDRYIDQENHNLRILILEEDGLKWKYVSPLLYEAILTGDSFLKETGELEATIRSNDGTRRTFNPYPHDAEPGLDGVR